MWVHRRACRVLRERSHRCTCCRGYTRVLRVSCARDGLIDSLMHPGNPAPPLSRSTARSAIAPTTVVILVAWPIAIEKSDRFLEFSTLYREIILIPALFRRGISNLSRYRLINSAPGLIFDRFPAILVDL